MLENISSPDFQIDPILVMKFPKESESTTPTIKALQAKLMTGNSSIMKNTLTNQMPRIENFKSKIGRTGNELRL